MTAGIIDPEEERLQRIAQRFRSKQGAENGIGQGIEQGASINNITGGDDIPPWEDDVPNISDAPAANLFPALNDLDGSPLPPPTPERDKDGYDRNNWSRLLRQARDMRPEIAEYLEVLRQTGIGLELKKYKKKNLEGKFVPIEKFNFTPGGKGEGNSGWDDRRIKEIMSALYTYMMYLPARKDLGQDNVVVQAMEAAIRAGGLLAVNSDSKGGGGLKFDWSGVSGENSQEKQEKINKARGLMDQCGAEIMSYIKLAERRLKDIGFCVSLAEMSDCVEEFG